MPVKYVSLWFLKKFRFFRSLRNLALIGI
jgi:hypothetical protein